MENRSQKLNTTKGLIQGFFAALGRWAIAFLVLGSSNAHADVDRGKLLYQERCSACHSLDYNGQGPAHRGVVGRAIGRAPGFDYSPALKNAQGRWTVENLDRWLADPERFLPGQRMGITVDAPKDRSDLIDYLKMQASRE